uniref:Putative CMP/dCMP deaminase zinc-binding n=1 Tax=viral metagenome TaxID=1070528 RepID=A0A6M3LDS0_9ZZZZ
MTLTPEKKDKLYANGWKLGNASDFLQSPLIEQWKKYQEPIERPSWKDLMMGLAYFVSTRSHDAQTQCGAVLCNQDNEIISTGYNGFIRGVDDNVLPNLRPDKYEYMIHSEHNAILNCARQGKSTKDTTIYVTGMPCLQCLQYIWQAGIKKVIHCNQQTNMQQSDESKAKSEIILSLTGLEIEEYIPQELQSTSSTKMLDFFTKLLERII